jgi:hypothetical protein
MPAAAREGYPSVCSGQYLKEQHDMKSPNFRTLVFIAVSVIVAACASSIVSKENYSGFLKDYSQLKEVKAPDGVMVMRYVSPKLTSGQYHAIMMDPVVFYPSPRANENVTTPVLDQIRNYMDATYREKIGARVTMVDQPGPGVARLSIYSGGAGYHGHERGRRDA